MLKKLLGRLRGSRQKQLPGYTALGTIREGSMSVVFKGRHRDTGQICAIKIYKPEARETIKKLEDRHRDFTEGQVTAAFDHPNVVKCFDHGRLGDLPYVVLEYLEGQTLASLMGAASKRLEDKRLDLLCQAARGLAHVHGQRFIHHDFCPKNLFITNDSVVKLIDFGLATPILNLPIPRSRLGTAEILAPELLRREPCDEKIDIFAWGVVAYELLSGAWPFESPGQHQKLNKILNVTPVPLERRVKHLDPELGKLVMRCLHKDPEKRLSSMTTVVGVVQRHLKKRAS